MINNYLNTIGLNALKASKDLSLLNEKKKNKVLIDFYKNLKLKKKRYLKSKYIWCIKSEKKGPW